MDVTDDGMVEVRIMVTPEELGALKELAVVMDLPFAVLARRELVTGVTRSLILMKRSGW